ncbi:MAG: hypothetical protein QOF30_18 [Acidimicrobiaceae bacterium]|jgi:post-segregation antitoxin (ccd killing protein)|nr:hypothetical protein [Acidimicrobiaceae bacterium]
MGLVRKATVDEVVPGEGGSIDMSSVIRQAVAAEIERQRLENLRLENLRLEGRQAEADESVDGD